MAIEWVRRFCLSLPHTVECVKWGNDLCFTIGEKMYLVMCLEPSPLAMTFKVTPEEFAEFTEHPGIIPAPYMARAHWISLESETALPRKEIERLIRQSYDLVVAKLPKKVRLALLG